MSIPVAIVLTGVILIFATFIIAVAYDTSTMYGNARARFTRVTWAGFALGVLLAIVGVWAGVLT